MRDKRIMTFRTSVHAVIAWKKDITAVVDLGIGTKFVHPFIPQLLSELKFSEPLGSETE